MKYAPLFIFAGIILGLSIRALLKSKTRASLVLFGLLAAASLSTLATGLISIVTATQQEFYYSPTALCIQRGSFTAAADGTFTQAFPVLYNFVVPTVFTMPQTNQNITTNEVYTLTLSNFVFKGGSPGALIQWMSIGQP